MKNDLIQAREEAEAERCEVKMHDKVLQFNRTGRAHCWFGIHAAVSMPDFIGYLYEGDHVSTSAVMYKSDTVFNSEFYLSNTATKPVRPTHVLFRKATP